VWNVFEAKEANKMSSAGVVGVADGYSGYCPTMYGVLGGGYSGEPILWTRLVPEAGYQLVDTAARLLHSLW